MAKIRLFITGGSSFFGSCFIPQLPNKFQTQYSYFSKKPVGLPHGVQLDIRDEDAVERQINRWQPQIILHLAGSNRGANMLETIVKGAAHIAAAANQINARLIHLSTDVLFDGSAAPYVETDPPAPIHAYGRAKAAAEKLIAAHPNHVIVRTSLIYSLRQPGHSVRWMKRALESGQQVTLFTNQWRNPIESGTLGGALSELMESDYAGILHVAGSQALTRAEFGLRLLDHYQIPYQDKVQFALSDPTQYPADVRLDCRQAAGMLQTPLIGVDTQLKNLPRPS